VLSKCAVEEYRCDPGKSFRALAELDNSVSSGKEGHPEWLYHRIKAAREQAREAAVRKSKWNGKLLEFITKTATNWNLEKIPSELRAWISKERDFEAAVNSKKWVDLKLLMENKS
jgi:hypothetical protein